MSASDFSRVREDNLRGGGFTPEIQGLSGGTGRAAVGSMGSGGVGSFGSGGRIGGVGTGAASPGGGIRDNANLLALAQTRTTGKFEGRVTALVGGNATALAAARTVASAQSAIREGAVARYDATAGVDIDNEAVDLIRYQQAYQGCARIIQVGRECFQSLINSV